MAGPQALFWLHYAEHVSVVGERLGEGGRGNWGVGWSDRGVSLWKRKKT